MISGMLKKNRELGGFVARTSTYLQTYLKIVGLSLTARLRNLKNACYRCLGEEDGVKSREDYFKVLDVIEEGREYRARV